MKLELQNKQPGTSGVVKRFHVRNDSLTLSVEDLFSVPNSANLETYYSYQWSCVGFFFLIFSD